MANYPSSIYSPRAKENSSEVKYDPLKKTVIFAEDIIYLENEVIALETELEGAVSREYPDNDAAKAAGLVDGQLYRTGDVLKIVHS